MKRIELFQGYTALVDNEDFDLVSKYKWYVFRSKNNIYVRVRINGKLILMHRLILGLENKPEIAVDHINGNGADNRRRNLRIATNAQNSWNSRKYRTWRGRPPSSKYKGVRWHKGKGRWQAQAMLNYKHIYLGQFDDEVKAAKAYNEFAEEHYGEFARLNVIEP